MTDTPEKKQRFSFIDQFRGLVVILMLFDHASYYINSIWRHLDPFDPLFASWGQFALRYVTYLCAPGFLMMNGAMVWWAYHRRKLKGASDWDAKKHLIHRGIFLILLQMTWVNSSWGGFAGFHPWHLGIISCIGLSMIFQSLIVNTKWYIQLLIALAILLVHPLLLTINYNHDDTWIRALMQTFIDAGEFNKYPLLPWFAQALIGSVIAQGWLKNWQTNKEKIIKGSGIAALAIYLSIIVRMGRGFGNILSFSNFGSYSFFLDQKYPPSLYFSFWFIGIVVLSVTLIIIIGKVIPYLLKPMDVVGKVALFFYCMHIAIMGVFIKRLNFFYREGGLKETAILIISMLVIMIPLCWLYGKLKSKSNNYFVRMI